MTYGSNSQNIVSINNPRTAWSTWILKLVLSSLDNLLKKDALYHFKKQNKTKQNKTKQNKTKQTNKCDNLEIEHKTSLF